MTEVRDALIIDGVRSPRGEGKPTGALHHLHPQELLAQVLNALSAESESTPPTSTTCKSATQAAKATTGCASGAWPFSPQAGPCRSRPSRSTATAAPANKRSRMLPPQSAPDTRTPLLQAASSRCRGWPAGRPRFDARQPGPSAAASLVPQGISAELSRHWSTTPGDVDSWRASQGRAATAADGRFDPARRRGQRRRRDRVGPRRAPRPNTTLADLAALRPAFERLGAMTPDGYHRYLR